MKLYRKLILILGGACLVIFLIQAAVLLTAVSGGSRVADESVSLMQEDLLKRLSESAGTGDAVYLNTKFNGFFSVLERVLSGGDTEKRMRECFPFLKSGEVDYIFVEKNGKILCLENPGRTAGAPVIAPEEYQAFLRLIRSAVGSGKRSILAARTFPGAVWAVVVGQSGGTAIFRISAKELLAGIPALSADAPAALVWDGGFIVARTDELPSAVTGKINDICGGSSGTPQTGKLKKTETVLTEDEKGNLWSISSARLDTTSEVSSGLHVVRAVRSPEPIPLLMKEIRDSFSGTAFLLAGAVFLSFLLFLPVLLIAARLLASQIGEAASFVREIFQPEKRPPNLDLKFSGELAELSGGLNLLRDKLNSALTRLSRSHERELRAKKNAEESNILRSELLKSVLAELRDPLARVDGFSRVIRDRSGGNPEISFASEEIRVENRAMISVFRALSDLTGLDAEFCELYSYQIEPSEIIRNAVGDLSRRAAENNISMEIQCSASLEEPLMTSPSVLTHTIYTAAATLIRFVPKNSTLRINCTSGDDFLVFQFSDQPSDHLSIAEVFRKYTETGTIKEPHCAVAVLNLLILKAETEYLGAAVEIGKTPDANSRIEIRIPILAFNPAVTGVFTRPKLKADPERSSTAARFHVAGIASVSLAGRGHFRLHGAQGAVLLANLKEPDVSLYRMVLELENFTVSGVSGREELERALRENRYDLLIVDMTMEPSGDSGIVAELRKAVPPSSVIIVLTESGKEEAMEELINRGADFCFRKPVVTEDLLSAIRNLKTGRRDFL